MFCFNLGLLRGMFQGDPNKEREYRGIIESVESDESLLKTQYTVKMLGGPTLKINLEEQEVDHRQVDQVLEPNRLVHVTYNPQTRQVNSIHPLVHPDLEVCKWSEVIHQNTPGISDESITTVKRLSDGSIQIRTFPHASAHNRAHSH